MEMKTQKIEKFKKWSTKFGLWAFTFFFVKGLVWLVLGYFIIK